MEIKYLLGKEKTKEVFDFVKDSRTDNKKKNKKSQEQTTYDENNQIKEKSKKHYDKKNKK